MKMLKIAAVVAMSLCAGVAAAQQLKVATGSATGTYSKLFKEMNNQCAAAGLTMIEVPSSGSIENVNNLLGNQINAAFVQTDVLFATANSQDLSGVKTLIALHPEEVHFVSPVNSGIKTGGYVGGIGATPVVFTTLSDLAGYKVGAAGGSVVSANLIRLQSEIAYQVVQYPDNKSLLEGLSKGEVQTAVLVGGAPLEAVALLGPDYKLLTVNETTYNKLKGVYRQARLSYMKMNAQGVSTIATDALLVTREYKTERMVQGLAKFRACVLNAIPELQETTGTHPKWQAIKPENKGKWAWYDLPVVSAAKK